MSDDEIELGARERSPIMRRAIAHFARDELREVAEVRDWADEDDVPVRVYCLPLSVREKQELMNDQRSIGLEFAAVNLIIKKACDRDGKPLFTQVDRRELREAVSPPVLESIAAGIMASEYAAAARIEKK